MLARCFSVGAGILGSCHGTSAQPRSSATIITMFGLLLESEHDDWSIRMDVTIPSSGDHITGLT